VLRTEFTPIIIVNRIAIANLLSALQSKLAFILVDSSLVLSPIGHRIELSVIAMAEAGIGVQIAG
jgi:hypothetical protein